MGGMRDLNDVLYLQVRGQNQFEKEVREITGGTHLHQNQKVYQIDPMALKWKLPENRQFFLKIYYL